MEMITVADVIGPWRNSTDLTEDRSENIADLVAAVNAFMARAQDAIQYPINPMTGTTVAGSRYGGFRPQDCTIGAPRSAHKEGLAVDLYDPQGQLDQWCLGHQDDLADCGLYLESPSKTPGWCHLTILAPRSGKRVFLP